ncbi:hypothetical protein [Streptomyces buecherae]|uniref:Uncharacterized protein n=1 Tax=Streptomyces buecherae TaxID=2763006 RepID=A0A7H8N8Q4_9ACTN|nr:hypothetical protein [Streptomyces buecherae]QKW50742.1 hypothetical protein HUT08_15730 [Streptomyces buecherae]
MSTTPTPPSADPTPTDSPTITHLRDDLHHLGITRPIPALLRVALRINHLHYLGASRALRIVAVLGVLLSVGGLVAIAVPLARESETGERFTLYDQETDSTYETTANASGAIFLFLLGGLLLLLLLRAIPALNRQVRLGREQAPTVALTRAIHACAQAYRTRGRRQAHQRRRLARRLARVATEIQGMHRARRALPASLPRYRHRRRRIKQHQRTVVGALQEAEFRIDSDGDAALPDIADLLLTIAERYTAGRIGALLDEARLAGVQPIPDREVWRVVTAVVLSMAASFAVALIGLPDDAVGPVIVGVSILAFVLVYGRDVRRALDILGVLHGP